MKVVTYIIYSDDASHRIGQQNFGHLPGVQFIKSPVTKYCESYTIAHLLPERYEEWKDADYVGVFGFRAPEKTYIPRDLITELSRLPADYDAVGFYCEPNLNRHLWCHGAEFVNNYRQILTKLGLGAYLANDMMLLASNYWYMRPSLALDYMTFLRKNIAKCDLDDELHAIMQNDAKYIRRPPHPPEVMLAQFGRLTYPYHPFVFERLTSVFLRMQNACIKYNMKYPFKSIDKIIHNGEDVTDRFPSDKRYVDIVALGFDRYAHFQISYTDYEGNFGELPCRGYNGYLFY